MLNEIFERKQSKKQDKEEEKQMKFLDIESDKSNLITHFSGSKSRTVNDEFVCVLDHTLRLFPALEH